MSREAHIYEEIIYFLLHVEVVEKAVNFQIMQYNYAIIFSPIMVSRQNQVGTFQYCEYV